MTRSPMARREPPWHERTTALDNLMEPADRTEIAPTGPSEMAEPLCAARARRDVCAAPLEEIHESVVCATEYLRLQLSWDCGPTMEYRLVTLHNDIDDALGAYALCAERNVSMRTELRNHLAWLLGDNLLEGAFDYDRDDYQDDYADTWDDETTWGKGSTTTPTTTTGGVQPITTPPQLITTPPHVFRFGSPAPPKAIHVDAGVSAMTLNHPADECADSTADDRAFAEHRADFTANGRADSIANDRADSTTDDRADSNMRDDGLSNATHDVAEVGLVAKTLLGNDLNDALRKQTLTLGQLRSAVAVKLSTTASRLKEDKAITALLKEEFTARHLLEMERPAAATAVASQVESDATFAAPVSSSPGTDDAPPVPKGASTSALRAGPDAQRRPPGPNGRRRTATPVRRRPLGTRRFERPSPLGSDALPVPVLPPGSHPPPPPPPEPPPTQHPADRHAPPTPAPPPGSHPAPLPPPEPPPVHRPTCRHAPPAPVPPPGSHPAPLPPPEPPPVQHPAPLPPPRPPPELEVGESDDENWMPPPPGSHPAPLPPPEPPPVHHPAPLPPPQPPPESKGGEFDDENWTLWAPYYLPASTTMASATTATAVQRARDNPLTLPDDTAPATVVPAMLP